MQNFIIREDGAIPLGAKSISAFDFMNGKPSQERVVTTKVFSTLLMTIVDIRITGFNNKKFTVLPTYTRMMLTRKG